MRASAGGGGSGGGGWLGSLGRLEDEDPDEDDVIDARVCSGMFLAVLINNLFKDFLLINVKEVILIAWPPGPSE